MNTAFSRQIPFFLETSPGKRFCIFYPPQGTCKGAVLYVPPFAEEMNKSRRMAALQARTLTGIGFAVLQIDLYGCGDSSGDFREARWEIWKNDLAVAVEWLKLRCDLPVSLWALRLGALLLLDFAHDTKTPIQRIVLWQPVHSGEAYVTQFLRLRLASAIIAGKAKTGLQHLRNELASRGTLEVGGYEIAHELVDAVSRLKLADLGKSGVRHHWLEIMQDVNQPFSPAASGVLQDWQSRGITAHACKVPGEPFWSVQEITDCPALIDKTTQIFSKAY